MSATVPQHMQALDRANAVYRGGAQWRREVAARPRGDGYEFLADLLANGKVSPAVGALRLSRFLTAPQYVGRKKAREITRDARIIRHDPRMRDLTQREREALARELRRQAERVRP